MILEGFEIENWACIKHVSVTGLPATGVVIFKAPNRTGKSSIVQALRACLMDYPSTSTSQSLKKSYPRGMGEKPVVTVTLRVNGQIYRVKKCFGSNKSEFAIQTATGAWRVETTSAAEVHTRICQLAGREDSRKGLQQLLWLTQREFHLPKPGEFDPTLQQQLRSILGVLQTPVDDRFIARIKERWKTWHTGQRNPTKQPALKKECSLATQLNELEKSRNEQQEIDDKFRDIEGLINRTIDLEADRRRLHADLIRCQEELARLEETKNRCAERLAERRLAEEQKKTAENEVNAARKAQQDRATALLNYHNALQAVGPAQEQVAAAQQNLDTKTKQVDESKRQVQKMRDDLRQLRRKSNAIVDRLKAIELAEKVANATRNLEKAEKTDAEIQALERKLADSPIPTDAVVKQLKLNRQNVLSSQATLTAAAMHLTLLPEDSASPAQVSIDGGPMQLIGNSEHAVHRQAELSLPGWGKIQLRRGVGESLDEIETKLAQLQETFAKLITPLGIAAANPRAMEILDERIAEHGAQKPIIQAKKGDLKSFAPNGIPALRSELLQLQAEIALCSPDSELLPRDPGQLKRLDADAKVQVADIEQTVGRLDETNTSDDAELVKLNEALTKTRELLAAAKAMAKTSRETLDGMPTDEELKERLENATAALAKTDERLLQTVLTAEEATINDRVAAAADSVRSVQRAIGELENERSRIKGKLEGSEGLHANRARLAARIEQLTRQVESETLEKDAIDRLYQLFDECREKQLGSLMTPIHDRIINWMRILDIGEYQQLHFNDSFLPDKLHNVAGTAEFDLSEESTGAQEQIAMLVRVALGSLLTSSNEPNVAVLDDPLTHADAGRMSKMRQILRRAAEGEPLMSPPSGPLQILVFTCHPEWFDDGHSMVINLGDPEVLSRYAI